MRKIFILILMAQMLPLSLMAQDDDLYFVPKEKKEIKQKKRSYDDAQPQSVYYSGSDRDVDEYNRRPARRGADDFVKIGVDSLGNDIYRFAADGDSLSSRKGRRIEAGNYDYDDGGDYKYTRRMRRYDGYDCHGMDYSDYCESYNSGYNNGYMDGMMSWNISFGWYDPWWYGSRFYGWNGWYNAYYFGGWYNPWYYGWGWHDPWWHGGYYYPIRHYTYYSGYSGTRNHSYGARGYGSRRHSVYNGHRGSSRYRNHSGYDSNRNRGFGGSRSNNRSFNENRRVNRNNNGGSVSRGGFGGGRSNGGGFGGGHRSGGGNSRGGRFGGGR